jgi:hypothetical protein
MPAIPLNLPTDSYVSKAGDVASPRIINAYLESPGQADGKNHFAIYAAPGLTRWNSGNYSGMERGIYRESDTRLLTLFGTQLVGYDATGKDTLISTVAGTGRAHFATNQNASIQTAIVTAEQDYYLLQGSSCALQTISAFPVAPNSVCYVKGVFVFGLPTGMIFASDVNAGTVQSTSFGSESNNNDALVRVFQFGGLLYIFKERSMAIWQADPNLAANPFFFTPAQQNLDFGLSIFHSVANFSGALIWVDQYGQVRMGRDEGAQVVSNKYIERLIAGLTPAQQAQTYGSVAGFQGNKFYTLRSPNWCVQFDPTGAPSWYERETIGQPTWRATSSADYAGLAIFGSSDAGALYVLDPSNYKDGPAPLAMEIWCPHLHKFPSWLSVRMLKLDVVTGGGLISGLPSDVSPQIAIDYSSDGGRTFQGQQLCSLGKIGEYAKTVETYNWGTVREKGRIWRFRASPAVLKCIQSATVGGSEVRPWRG